MRSISGNRMMEPMTTDTLPNDPDLLVGAREIGAAIKRTPKATYKLAEAGLIPTFKLGGLLYCRRSTLREFYASLERQSSDAAE
jgi:hypothetical protein